MLLFDTTAPSSSSSLLSFCTSPHLCVSAQRSPGSDQMPAVETSLSVAVFRHFFASISSAVILTTPRTCATHPSAFLDHSAA